VFDTLLIRSLAIKGDVYGQSNKHTEFAVRIKILYHINL
jgi:hypothetical protein